MRAELEDFNDRVRKARIQPLGGPPMITQERDVDAEVERWSARRAARHAEQQAPLAERETHETAPPSLALLDVTTCRRPCRRDSRPTLSRDRDAGGRRARGLRATRLARRLRRAPAVARQPRHRRPRRARRGHLVARRHDHVDGGGRGRLPAAARRGLGRAGRRLRAAALPGLGHPWRRPGRPGLDEPRRAAAPRPPARAGARHRALRRRRVQHGHGGRRRAGRAGRRPGPRARRGAPRPDPRLLRPGPRRHGRGPPGRDRARASPASTRRCCPCSPAGSTRSGPATSTARRSTSATGSPTSPGCATGPRRWRAGRHRCRRRSCTPASPASTSSR